MLTPDDVLDSYCLWGLKGDAQWTDEEGLVGGFARQLREAREALRLLLNYEMGIDCGYERDFMSSQTITPIRYGDPNDIEISKALACLPEYQDDDS